MSFAKLHKFINLGMKDRLFFMRVLFILWFCKIVVLLVPFRKVMPYLGKINGSFRDQLTDIEKGKAGRIRHFMFMVSNNVKWNSVCLDQAMATVILLNNARIPNCICFGVKKEGNTQKLAAHAWVLCDGDILIGGNRSKSYTEVARFSKDF